MAALAECFDHSSEQVIAPMSTPLRPSPSVAEFLRDPLDHFIAGRTFVVWARAPRLIGASYFGRLDPEDHGPLLQLFDLYRHSALEAPYEVVIDGSQLAAIDMPGFCLLSQYLSRWSDIAPRIQRFAFVQPPSTTGLAHIAAAGLFHQTIAPTVSSRFVESRAQAFEWLRVSPDVAASVEAVLHGNHEPELLRDLRRHLADDLHGATLERAARALGTSTRSLQRRLSELQTSFRAQLDSVRIGAAKTLLLESELKIEAIASEVGCRSPSVLYELFRRLLGESPLQFRQRYRGL
jgi:AraC-like DNA-binding protein